ncbi:MAG: cytidylate kinase-like family protein [Hungatella sp.]|jgi:cytidylate kinase|nr:cytidylate kinase-like family protein [uncultured Acetatifactor sp.]MCI8727192.1 cytidylate kinase-like family protein [Hungatella sp.]
MKIITISRQFGSGGRELGRRLADELQFDYYDKEIITAIAQKQGLKEAYVERTLDSRTWQSVPLTFRRSLFGVSSLQSAQTSLLLEQKRVIEAIAKNKKDCVIVGRNADVILQEEHPFNIFVCADMDARIRRCMERASEGENLSPKELEQSIRRIDKNRAATREILTSSPWGRCGTYHLTVNTTDWNMKDLTPAVAAFITHWYKRRE